MDSGPDKKKLGRKRLEMWLGRRALLAVSRVALALPEGTALRTGARLGSLAYRLSRRYRNVTIQNLTQVFGDKWDRERIESTAQDAFRHVGMNLVEFLRFPGVDPARLDEIVRVEGEEHVQQALTKGHGVIAVTAHYGNFELFGAAFARKGYPLSVIARDADDDETNDLINAVRDRMGYHVFSRRDAAFRAMAVLRSNEVLGVLPDQNDLDGVFVPFLGRLAATPTGPAFMALRTGAVLLPAFIHREPDNRHVVKIFPVIPFTPTGELRADIKALTILVNQAIEVAIREHPEQWFWLHDRWRHRPPNEVQSGDEEAAS